MPPDVLDRIRPQTRALTPVAGSLNEGERTVEYILATEEPTLRYSYVHGPFYEVLSCEEGHVDTRRLASGRTPWIEDHNEFSIDKQVGTIIGYRWIDRKLAVKVQYHQTARATEIWERVKRGELPNCSAGYDVRAYQALETEGEIPTRTAVDWEVQHGALVSTPADNDSAQRGIARPREEGMEVRLIGGTRNMPPETNETTTENTSTEVPTQQSNGADTGTQGGETQSGTGAAGGGEAPPAASTPAVQEPVAGTRAANQAPQGTPVASTGQTGETRQASLEYIIARGARSNLTAQEAQELHGQGLSEAAIADELLARAQRRSGGNVQGNHNVSVGEEAHTKLERAVESALLTRADPENFPAEDIAGDFRGRRMLHIGEQYLSKVGTPISGTDDMKRAKSLLQRRSLGGMHTPSDFPQLLGNVVHKTMLKGYESVEPTFEAFTRVVSVSDFREVTRVRMGDAPELRPITDTGEYEVGTFGEGGEKYRIHKFGRKIPFSRETIVNDDVGMLGRTPAMMGGRARELENALPYDILKGNPLMADGEALFSAAHGNILTGGLDDATLSLVMIALAGRKGLDGKPIKMRMKNLIISVHRADGAWRLLVADTTPNTSTQANRFRGSLNIIEDVEMMGLANPLTYFLSADPHRNDVIELAFLEGQRAPYTETEYGFDTDGVQIKIRHELGAKAIDHAGLFRVTP